MCATAALWYHLMDRTHTTLPLFRLQSCTDASDSSADHESQFMRTAFLSRLIIQCRHVVEFLLVCLGVVVQFERCRRSVPAGSSVEVTESIEAVCGIPCSSIVNVHSCSASIRNSLSVRGYYLMYDFFDMASAFLLFRDGSAGFPTNILSFGLSTLVSRTLLL